MRLPAHLDPSHFSASFAHFIVLYEKVFDSRFISLREGAAAAWEDYKPRLRDKALARLQPNVWGSDDIGSGRILDATIAAIELAQNNLVFWQNRYGHANRDHAALIEARNSKTARTVIESALFDLYAGNGSEAAAFELLKDATWRKYPLIADLFFMKDDTRFMPLQPTGFDRAFRALGIDFATLGNCSFSNYSIFNAILGEIATALELCGQRNVRLIDAHSFCWIYATLLKQAASGDPGQPSGGRTGKRSDPGYVHGARERSIYQMKQTIIDTAKHARGQTVEQITTRKRKDLGFDSYALEEHIRALLARQNDRCMLTGIPFAFHSEDADPQLLPSADRIDSDGHYEAGNIQIVCRFINFWKGSIPNAEFVRLLDLVRRGADSESESEADSDDLEMRRARSAPHIARRAGTGCG